MANIVSINDDKKNNQPASHHSESGDEKAPPAGPCPSADELADMAAGECSDTKREEILCHFTACRKCYDAWIAISFRLAALDSMPGVTPRRVFSFRNVVYLTAAGVAVACLVGVFFTR